MKIAIIFDSQTGNTAQVAQAIRDACEGHDIVAFGPPPQNVDQAELIFAGSWTDKGFCTAEMKEFLHSLYGKRVALFGTAGFGISELYFASLSDRFKAEVPKGNQVVSSFFCITLDFQTVGDENTPADHCVTIRERDSMEQVRIPMDQVKAYIAERVKF